MRIVVNDIAASKGGALSVLKDFYNCIKENDKENEWIFLLGDSYLEETGNIKVIILPQVKKSSLKKLWFDFFSGKKYIGKLKPDVVVSLQNIITFGLKIPQIVYIHQSIPFQNQKEFSFLKGNERKLAVYQHLIGRIIKRSAKFADKIIVQTEWMKKAVCQKANTSSEKIYVVTPNIKIPSDIEFGKYNCKSFFYPTSNSIYKNNGCIFKACESLNKSGIQDFSVDMTIKDISISNISAIGYIPREEVLKRYTESTLVFPSYIESFAYPLAEARRFGAIILASDCDFSREVLSGYSNAYFFNPFKPEELAELMKKVMSGEVKRTESSQNMQEENTWLKVLEIIKE